MIHTTSLCRPNSRRLINALRRKTTGNASHGGSASQGGRSAARVMRNALPNGDPPTVTLWGEE
jgi:hypothetical protein